MSWFDILKELSDRERMDAEDFAPEEMGEWREEQANDANLHLLEKYAERFAVFDSKEMGIRALALVLNTKIKRKRKQKTPSSRERRRSKR